MLNKFIDLERLTEFFQGLKDIFLQKSEASTTYATKLELENIDVTEQLQDYQKTEAKGIAGGYAALGQDGKVPVSQLPDTTYNVATTSANGLMSSADKAKLNGVEAGAQKNIMTSADKTKLDGIETGAQKNTITSVQGRTGAVTISKSDVGLDNVNNVAITQSDIDRLRGMSLDLFITEAQYEALSTEAKNLPLTIYNFIEEA